MFHSGIDTKELTSFALLKESLSPGVEDPLRLGERRELAEFVEKGLFVLCPSKPLRRYS
jgi:hypothetical protein